MEWCCPWTRWIIRIRRGRWEFGHFVVVVPPPGGEGEAGASADKKQRRDQDHGAPAPDRALLTRAGARLARPGVRLRGPAELSAVSRGNTPRHAILCPAQCTPYARSRACAVDSAWGSDGRLLRAARRLTFRTLCRAPAAE